MTSLGKYAAAAVLALLVAVISIQAQGPIQKRVDYTINTEHALRMGDYVLPAGKYVLFQVSPNDLNLFALYKDNRQKSPIAMIRTTRIQYLTTEMPEKTSLMLSIDEDRKGRDDLPVLKGWNIPGMDGWEIISVVEKKRGLLARAN
jgi:hypothetical protein